MYRRTIVNLVVMLILLSIIAGQINAQIENVVPVQDWIEKGRYLLLGNTYPANESGRNTFRPQVRRYVEWHSRQQQKFKVMGWTDGKTKVLTWTYYYSDGNREKQGIYKDDQQHGVWTFWDKSGIETTVEYDHGNALATDETG